MTRNPRVSATVKAKVKEGIEKIAEREGETESGMVAIMLERAVAADQKKSAAK